jgi:hypothetical protein
MSNVYIPPNILFSTAPSGEISILIFFTKYFCSQNFTFYHIMINFLNDYGLLILIFEIMHQYHCSSLGIILVPHDFQVSVVRHPKFQSTILTMYFCCFT